MLMFQSACIAKIHMYYCLLLLPSALNCVLQFKDICDHFFSHQILANYNPALMASLGHKQGLLVARFAVHFHKA